MSQSFFPGSLPLSQLILFALLGGVLLVNGWTDAPNAIAGVVTSGAMTFRHAVLLAAAGNFLGVLSIRVLPARVSRSMELLSGFSPNHPDAGAALAAVFAAVVLWAVFAWRLGIPTSESHALMAGLAGAGMALDGAGPATPLSGWLLILGGLVFSSGLGITAGWLACRLFSSHTIPVRRMYALQRLGAAGSALLHGMQDGQKFWGLFLLLARTAHLPSISFSRWLLLCAGLMSLGTLLGGRRIIDTIAVEMVSLSPKDSFFADCGSILALSAATAFGFPVSTTHTRTCSLLGAGKGSGTPIRTGAVRSLFGIWLLTFPACGLLAFLLTGAFCAAP